MPRLTLAALLLGALALSTAWSDIVVLNSGEELVGRITQEDFVWVTLRTRDGDMSLRREHIAEIHRAPGGPPTPTETLPVDPRAELPRPGELAVRQPEFQPLSDQVAQAVPSTPSPPPEPGEEIEPTGEEQVPRIEPGYAGTIFMVDGEIWLKRHEEWVEGLLGDQLQVGNEVRTDAGRSKLLLLGRGELRLPPNSHLRLDAIDDEGHNVTLNLVRGSVWVNVEPPDTGGLNFNVQTPDLTAGVRGTLFNVTAIPASGSRISVTQGVVLATSVRRPNQSVNVRAGYSVFCDLDGNLHAPELLDDDYRDEWEEWDQWALETHMALGGVSPYGGDAIGGLVQLNAMDQQRYAQINAAWAASENLNRQSDFLQGLATAFVVYAEDVLDLPPSEEPLGADGWRALIENPGVAGWNGPYLPPNTEVPVLDGWQNPIAYRRQRSQMSGNLFGDLISNGPNGIFSQGQTDDLRVLISLTSELQAAVQANLAP
jgi:FecR protein